MDKKFNYEVYLRNNPLLSEASGEDETSPEWQEGRMMMIGGDKIGSAIEDLLQNKYTPEDILKLCQKIVDQKQKRMQDYQNKLK